ncbi:MAG: hypothetical protein GX823_00720, partial [Clostridiales bacterium]|nr:hypothetical protein [Clostridiales bacterium]
MEKRFVKRPLALFSGGFALATAVFHYLPERVLLLGSITLLVRLVFLFMRRTGSPHIKIAATGALLGFAWCYIFSPMLAEAHALIKTMSDSGEGIFRVSLAISEAVGGSVDSVFPERLAPFIRAITIGDAAQLQADSSVYTPLSMSGIAHIVAVSGMHVTFLISMIS